MFPTRHTFRLTALLLVAFAIQTLRAGWAVAAGDMTLLSTRKIWNSAPHNAFPDIEWFNGQMYVSLREASRHAVPDVGQLGGNIRIIRSSDTVNWSSAALISFGVDHDLRDAKLSIDPHYNRLMLIGIDQPHDLSPRQSLAWFSVNGSFFGAAEETVEQGRWLWRETWNEGFAWGISYQNSQTRLHKSADGIHYSTVVTNLSPGNESTLLFQNDGTAVAIVRREDDVDRIGTSSGSLTTWNWVDATHFVGGPDLLQLPDGRIIVGGRFTNGTTRTALAFLDPTTGVMSDFLNLPSGGDTGYTGLLWHDDKLYATYYSSHEGKASIYLSTIDVHLVPEPGTASILIVAVSGLSLRRRA